MKTNQTIRKTNKMSTRSLTQASILMAMGTILHLLPGFVNGLKPDFMLVCVFLAIILDPKPAISITVGVVGGALAGLTTSMPGGFLPNLIDKIVAAIFVYLLVKYILKEKTGKQRSLVEGLIFFLGTIVSGFIFLSLMLMSGALSKEIGLVPMLVGLVLPTAVMNILVGLLFHGIIGKYIAK